MRCTDGVFVGKSKLQPIGVAFVDWVVVEHFDVHLPLFQIVGFGDRDAWWYVVLHLEENRRVRASHQAIITSRM